MIGLRKWFLALVALLGAIGLGWHGNWDAYGYGFAISAALVPHAAASVYQSKRLAGNRKLKAGP